MGAQEVHGVLRTVVFTAAPSVLAQLSTRRDGQQKRVDSLLKLKNEFQELSRIL